MLNHSIQHTVREPSPAKRFAVIVAAGLVATIATVMVDRMPAPLTPMSPVSGTVQEPSTIAIGSLRHIARLRCAWLSGLLDLFDRHGPIAATGGYIPATHKPAVCPVPTVLADIGLDRGAVPGRSLVFLHAPLAVGTQRFLHARRGFSLAGSKGVSGIDIANRRGNGDEASADAQPASRYSTKEFPDET